MKNGPTNWRDPTGELFNAVGFGFAIAIDVVGQLYRNDWDWRCIDLVETGVAAATGAFFPGAGTILKDYLMVGSVSAGVIGGAAAGAVVRGAYSVSPDRDGPSGRLTLPLDKILGGIGVQGCECKK